MFKAFKIFLRLRKQYRHLLYWNHVDDAATWAKLLEFTIRWYSWEIKYGSGDKIPELLEQVKHLDKEKNTFWGWKQEAEDKAEKLVVEHQKEIKRYELEAIHLKELVQEKNMVIDKLLAQIKVPQRES